MIARAVVALALIAGAWSASAPCAQWSVDPAVYLRADQIYNPYLASSDRVTLYSGRLSVRAPVRIEGETAVLSLIPQLSGQRYDRAEELNGGEASVDLSAEGETEVAVWRLGGNAARTSTWTSEWDDTGFVGARKWRITRALQPSVQWQATERTTLSLSGDHSEVQYADARDTALVGYDYSAFNMSASRELNEQVSGGIALYTTRLEAPRIDNTSDDFGAQFTLAVETNPAWTLRMQAGGHRTHGRIAGTEDWQGGATSELRLMRAGERGQLDFALSRSVSPSGFGVLLRRDQLLYTQSHALAERVSASLLLRWQRDESLTASRADANRRAARMEWRLNLELTPRWNFAFGVDYARQRYEHEPRGAEMSALVIQIGYHAGSVPLNARAETSTTD